MDAVEKIAAIKLIKLRKGLTEKEVSQGLGARVSRGIAFTRRCQL